MKFISKTQQTRILRCLVPYIDKAKQVSLPGLDQVPIYNVGLFFFRGIKDGAINMRASAVAYSLMLALFPAILFIFTLIPIIFQEELLRLIQSIVPASVDDSIQKIITDIVGLKHRDILSVGFILALFFSTNGIVSLIQSFNASVNVAETRSWIMQRLIAIVLVIILSLLITIAIALITFTQTVMNFLVDKGLMVQDWTYYLITFGKWLIILALFYFAFSFLYYLGPARKSKFRFISAGATLATVLSILATLGFGFYIDNFGNYNALYGSIGTFPIIMLMIYLNCMAIIIGFELNSGIVAARKIHLENIIE